MNDFDRNKFKECVHILLNDLNRYDLPHRTDNERRLLEHHIKNNALFLQNLLEKLL